MSIYKVYHFQAIPSKSQIRDLDHMFDIGKNFWNYILDLDQTNYNQFKKSLSKSQLEKQVKILKTQKEYSLLHTHLFQTIIKRFCDAKSLAFLKFKSKQSKYLEFPSKKEAPLKSLIFKEYKNGCKIIGNKIKFNHLLIKFTKHCDIIGKICTIQIKKLDSNKFKFIIISSVEDEIIENNSSSNKILNQYRNCKEQKFSPEAISNNSIKELLEDKSSIGIDLGIKMYAVLSNGTVYSNQKFYNKLKDKIKYHQQQLSLKVVGSSRYLKKKRILNKWYEKLANSRTDYLHRLSKDIVSTYQTIIIEDLSVKKMISKKSFRSQNRSNADACWGKFICYLTYKCSRYGKKLIKVNPYNTSQTCCNCGETVVKELSDRVHNCKNCGFEADRDYNSSIEILYRGVKDTKSLDRAIAVKSEKCLQEAFPS